MSEQNYFDPKQTSENISKIMGNYRKVPFPSSKKKKTKWEIKNPNPMI